MFLEREVDPTHLKNIKPLRSGVIHSTSPISSFLVDLFSL